MPTGNFKRVTSRIFLVSGSEGTARKCSAPARISNIQHGWFQEYQGGAGILQVARGVLDSSPKEPTYPHNPYGGDPDHTEGWVTFNTSWNVVLVYLAADVTHIAVYDADFSNEIDSATPGDEIGIKLNAPLNFDHNQKEMAEVRVYLGEEKHKMALDETSNSSLNFRDTFSIPETMGLVNIKTTTVTPSSKKRQNIQ